MAASWGSANSRQYFQHVGNSGRTPGAPSEPVDTVPGMNDQQLLRAARFAVGSAQLVLSFRAPVGRGIWFTLSNGRAFSIERVADGWDLADVTACL